MGPFESQALQWHYMHADISRLAEGDRIVGYTGDTVSAVDARTPIAYPPLHMHHIHIQREVPHLFETHGDYTMDRADGYRLQLPEGKCVVNAPPQSRDVSVWAHVNDVRFADSLHSTAMATEPQAEAVSAAVEAARSKSEPYSWYLRVKLELAPPGEKCERVDKGALFHLYDSLGMRDSLTRYNASNSTHVAFWTIRPTRTGQVVARVPIPLFLCARSRHRCPAQITYEQRLFTPRTVSRSSPAPLCCTSTARGTPALSSCAATIPFPRSPISPQSATLRRIAGPLAPPSRRRGHPEHCGTLRRAAA